MGVEDRVAELREELEKLNKAYYQEDEPLVADDVYDALLDELRGIESEHPELLTPDIIDAIHAAGYVVWVWPNDRALETAAAYAEFLTRGVDGLNINDPVAGVAAVEAFVSAPPPPSSGT